MNQSPKLVAFLVSCRNEWLRCKAQEILECLKEDRELGVKIPKYKIPRQYVKQWGVENLYKCNLGPDWRMTYTLVFDGAGVGVFALEIVSHKDYDRLFGYKTT